MNINNMRVGREKDRRIKLTDEDKQEIKKLYHVEKLPIREIARIFENRCSRRLIQFVLFPERLKSLQKRGIETKHHLKYYDKDKQRVYHRNHRAYKKRLINN